MQSEFISGCIISHNNEWSIKNAIRSLMNITSEVIVFDFCSTDKTKFLAKDMNVYVASHEYVDNAEIKSLIENLCSNNWIFILYANEYVSNFLSDEIQYVFKNNLQDQYKAYTVLIKSVGSNDLTHKNFAYAARKTRLYNKVFSLSNYDYEDLKSNRDICGIYGGKEDLYHLQGYIYVRLRFYLENFISQINILSSIQAGRFSNQVRSPSVLKIIFVHLLVFLNYYFLKRYFLFGFSGFMDAYILGLQKMFFLAKLREKKLYLHRTTQDKNKHNKTS